MRCAHFHRRAALVKRDELQEIADAAMALWHDVAVAVARSDAARDANVPARWADAAVKGYLATVAEVRKALK